MTLSEQQYFVSETASQKHKMTRSARNFGGHGPHLQAVADPGGGAVWGNCPPKRLWRPFEWRLFAINAPRFGAHGNRNRLKNTLK